jgi:hypothetical protein
MSRISIPAADRAAGRPISNEAPGHSTKHLLIGALAILALAGCGNVPGGPPGAYGREPQYSPWLSYDGGTANHPHVGSGTHGGGARPGGGHAGGGRSGGGHGGGRGR